MSASIPFHGSQDPLNLRFFPAISIACQTVDSTRIKGEGAFTAACCATACQVKSGTHAGMAVSARDFDRQIADVQIHAEILNRVPARGFPRTVALG